MMDVTRLRLAYALCSICVFCASGGFGDTLEKYLVFPKNFHFGTASSAYQVEGAWNQSGKGESTWDRFTHKYPSPIVDNSTGDEACEAYYRTESDVALLKKMGFNSYRFSISWSRILPHGFANLVNTDGIRYYHELLNKLIENGIQPLVTIYHWDLPQDLEDAGGWLNPKIVDWFTDYAYIVFQEFGPKVKYFITFNEPMIHCLSVYEGGSDAPGIPEFHGTGPYECLHNILKAHARAYRLYERKFKATQKGLVGTNIQIQTFYPKYSNGSAAAHRAFEFLPGWFLHPIYSKEGDYPKIMKELIAKKSKEQGFPKSRLPTFSPAWVNEIQGSSDIMTVNYYTSQEVEDYPGDSEPSFFNDWDIKTSQNPAWENTSVSWQKVYAPGFGDGLRELAKTYDNPLMLVAENGVSTGPELNDTGRIQFLHDHMREVLIAHNRDNVNVMGHYMWSFMDSFEFNSGYSVFFGLVRVNHADPEKKRIPKASADYMTRVINAAKNNEVLPER